MSHLAYPAHSIQNLPQDFAAINDRLPRHPYPINAQQLDLCRQWIATLRTRRYIPITRLLRADARRFSAPGVACQLLTTLHPNRFSWHRRTPTGAYAIRVHDTRTKASVHTWIGCYLGITPEGMEKVWKLNDSGRYTFPQIANTIQRMISNERYFTLGPQDAWQQVQHAPTRARP